jgi:acetoacetate decarboxylase
VKQPGDRSEYHPRRVDLKGMASSATAEFDRFWPVGRARPATPAGGALLSNRFTVPMEPESIMNEAEILTHAFAMPLTSPAFPRGPYRFFDREYLIITYRTDPDILRRLLPEPLEIARNNPVVKYEIIRMPNSTGFGSYSESG